MKTLPYPGFPTDLQPQLMSLLTTCSGQSVLEETVFEGRMRHGMFYALIHRATFSSIFFTSFSFFAYLYWSVILISFCMLWFSGGATEAWSDIESESKHCHHQWQSRWQVFETAQTQICFFSVPCLLKLAHMFVYN